MIRYNITLKELSKRIEKQCPGWLSETKSRTRKFVSAKLYDEEKSIWFKVKAVYMRLQGDSKCAYCERPLPPVGYGETENDVEHFRPKKAIMMWKNVKNVSISLVGKKMGGYYKLPYHLFNYAIACKICNSVLKRNFFPISSTYKTDGNDPERLNKKELPLLIYPIGAVDDDPERLIRFYGHIPLPSHATGYEHDRAKVTIKFFALASRSELIQSRTRAIVGLYQLLKESKDGVTPMDRSDAKRAINNFINDEGPDTNCLRCYCELFNNNRREAEVIYRKLCRKRQRRRRK